MKKNEFFHMNEQDPLQILDPRGQPFYSKGVNAIRIKDPSVLPGSRYYDMKKKYPDPEDWADSVFARLKKWGFNTVGSWSTTVLFKRGFPYTVMLKIPRAKKLIDLFDPEWEKEVSEAVKEQVSEHIGRSDCFGYFLANEQAWFGDWPWITDHNDSLLLDEYLKLPDGSSGKLKARQFLKDRTPGHREFNELWGMDIGSLSELDKIDSLPRKTEGAMHERSAFAGRVAERFFSIVTGVLRKEDPDHLILGVRFAGEVPEDVVRACGRYNDILSQNYYRKNMIIEKDFLEKVHEFSSKPVMITEFSYRAMENRSGLRNRKGADVTVQTQSDRAEGFKKYVGDLLKLPFICGYHWFLWHDQSPEGRSFDGEDSNYGIVDLNDEPYEELVEAMKDVNVKTEG